MITLLAADDVDAVLLTGYFGGYSTGTTNLTEPELEAARMIGAAAVEWGKPVVVQTIFPDSPSPVLLDAAIPVHRDIDRACAVLAALVVRETPETPRCRSRSARSPTRRTTPRGRCSPRPGSGSCRPARCTRPADLQAALADPELTPPLVLKAVGSLHKSDDGGVVLGLADARRPRRPTTTWSPGSTHRRSRSR